MIFPFTKGVATVLCGPIEKGRLHAYASLHAWLAHVVEIEGTVFDDRGHLGLNLQHEPQGLIAIGLPKTFQGNEDLKTLVCSDIVNITVYDKSQMVRTPAVFMLTDDPIKAMRFANDRRYQLIAFA